MDVNDDSNEEWLARTLQMWEENVDQAWQRKGQPINNFLSPEELVLRHNIAIQRFKARKMAMMASDIYFGVSLVPYMYPPCERPIKELRPILFKDMKFETQHRGRKVYVRLLTPPLRISSILAIVEDEQGTALTLQVYHQPTVMPPEEIMADGDVFILKEPYLKTAPDGRSSLRVDHLGDVVKLAKTDHQVPSQWRSHRPATMPSSESLRLKGNVAVQRGEWAKAHRL